MVANTLPFRRYRKPKRSAKRALRTGASSAGGGSLLRGYALRQLSYCARYSARKQRLKAKPRATRCAKTAVADGKYKEWAAEI